MYVFHIQGEIAFDVNGSRLGHNGIYQLGENIVHSTLVTYYVCTNVQYVRIHKWAFRNECTKSCVDIRSITEKSVLPTQCKIMVCVCVCVCVCAAVPSDDGESLELKLLYVQNPHQVDSKLPTNFSEWLCEPRWKGQPHPSLCNSV